MLCALRSTRPCAVSVTASVKRSSSTSRAMVTSTSALTRPTSEAGSRTTSTPPRRSRKRCVTCRRSSDAGRAGALKVVVSGRGPDRLMSPVFIRRLRLGAAFVLLTYLILHFINHALGIVSLDAMAAGRWWFLALWRSAPGTLALYGAITVHGLLALWLLY